MTSAQIRQQFLDFFVKKHGHTFVPSSPVVPLDDPTLLFTNAGMNQFKPIFLGLETRPYTRAANTQKCIRAGGKHNDLDDVGRSRRHGTFFEMLGNWSFGDYFKRGAIEMAWELLTQVWKMDPTRLHVTCYEGDEKNGIPRDTEAADLWKQIAHLPDDHIHFFGKDNFWEMGDTGPCGPCTEIYIDRTPDKSGGPQVNGEDPRVMEFWNLVFIQYNRDAVGKLTPLPARHVDTGMGFERICSILQDKSDMYGIDLFDPFFAAIAQLSGFKYTGKFPKTNAPDPAAEAADPQLRHDIAFRVIADHLRTLTFALTDGAVPSNEGRGYVLRRILRRAVRFGRQQLELTEPFLHKLVPVVVDSMGDAFPDLKKNPSHVAELIKDEEVSFGKTLDRGIQLFDEAAAIASSRAEAVRKFGSAKIGLEQPYGSLGGSENPQAKSKQPMISAQDGFKLHDTYGFPIDLTRIMAEERGMTVDIDGYEKLMEQARQLARAGGKTEDSHIADLPPDALAQLSKLAPPTDDRAKYSHDPIQARVLAIWDGESLGHSPASADEDDELAIILDRTNFYPEMGGQVGDTGELRLLPSSPSTTPAGNLFSRDPKGSASPRPPSPSPGTPGEGRGEGLPTIFDVQSTKTAGSFILHIGRLRSGKISEGVTIQAIVSLTRTRTEKNHTATHLTNWALRQVLGDGVQQKGSLVDPEKLRFDFSHSHALTPDQITTVQDMVRERIEAKPLDVFTEEVPQEKAVKINGLRAVFGEKYPPIVRVVSIGVPVQNLLANPTNPDWRNYSIEFCGGTHLTSTRQTGPFAIVSEESVSKGIRRITALTGDPAKSAWQSAADLDETIEKAEQSPDPQLQPLITDINQRLAAPLPLAAKRRAQSAVAELHARQKAFEKASKSQPSTNVDAIKLAADLLAQAPAFGSGKLIVGEIQSATDDQLRAAIDSLKKKSPTHAILLAASTDQKITLIAAVSDDLIAKGLKAGDWIKQVAASAGGNGGGRPQMAQGSAKDPTKLPTALQTALTTATKFA
jgi:alanyl-tRNA synthetase